MNENMKYISIQRTARMFNKSVRTIWRWIAQKKSEGFPQPIRLSTGSTVLDFDELCFWITKKTNAMEKNYDWKP